MAPPTTGTTTQRIPTWSANVSRDGHKLLTWQVADPNVANIQELLETPILFFNGHKAPEFTAKAKQNLRDFVDQWRADLRRSLLPTPNSTKDSGD